MANSPSADKRISIEEIQFIHRSIGFTSKDAKVICAKFQLNCIKMNIFPPQAAVTPWSRIFSSLPVYSIVVAHFCENWGFYTMMTFLPRFLEDISNEALSKVSLRLVNFIRFIINHFRLDS